MGQFWVDDYRRFVADFADRFEFGELMSPSEDRPRLLATWLRTPPRSR
jgi:hypothetical protein